ncbi:hypothetical protein O3M35_009871 [Rhynocoris fuscipes]|uniref:Cytochrome P450 n=1 Tax=Rhynocoris fuscipes TaxID=488301 RepID=A0AAW1D4J9_9HEMI
MWQEIVLFLIICLLLICLILPLELIDIRWKVLRTMCKLPGPYGVPLLGLGILIARAKDTEIMDLIEFYCKRYPRFMSTYVVGVPIVVLQDPADIEVLLGSVNHITKGREYFPLVPWLREGLLLSSGEKWHQRRKLLTPTFHFRILEDNMQSLNKHARQLIKNMLKEEGKPFIAEDLVTLCTLDVICETAMGFSLNTQQDDHENYYVKTVKKISNMMVTRLRTFWLRKDWVFDLSALGKQFQKNLSLLHNFTEKIIKERKISYKMEENITSDCEEESVYFSKKRKAFLDSLLELDKKYPNLFTDLDIREEVDTFMFEGHDTTSAAIVFALFLLANHPDVQEKAYQEQFSIFGISDRAATRNDLQEMHYLEMVIKETLRLYPSVPYISRILTQDLLLSDNTLLPEGINTSIIPVMVHRNPTYFPDPEKFDPERFTQENCRNRHPFAYIPFSAGPRNCIGQKFAMMELKVVLSTVIRFLKIEPVTRDGEFKTFPFLIIRTDPPIKIKTTPRMEHVQENITS